MRILALVVPDLRLPEADVRPWERMLDALDDLSPRVEGVDAGVALVDATGLEPMWGSERRVAARAVALVRGVAPIGVRCGVGENRWLATLAARLARFERPDAPAAFRALDRSELGALPLDLLPADAATRQRFALFGLTRMAQLASLPRSAVGAQFGVTGERLQALARGHDPRPLVPRRRPARVEAAATFETPLDGLGSVGLTLRRLATDLCDRLRERHLAPGRAVLDLRLEDAPPLRVAQPFPQPALEPDWIARLLLSRLEAAARARHSRHSRPLRPVELPPPNHARLRQLPPPNPVHPGLKNIGESMPTGLSLDPGSANVSPERTLELDGAEVEEPRVVSVHLVLDRLGDPATSQLPAFEARTARWEELRWSLERIRHRFGEGRLWRASVERPTAALPEHRSRLVDIGA